MSTAEPPVKKLMTAEEFWALPDDGTSRELIRGEVREFPISTRNRRHARIEATIAKLLGNWLDTRPAPAGEILSGDGGFRLRGTPDSLVGIDVAYASAELVASSPPKMPYFDGPPVLAVEVLSPSDVHENVVEKVSLYLEAGSVVWLVDPDFRTVSVHQPGELPRSFDAFQELDGGPYLPGFRVAVADLFK